MNQSTLVLDACTVDLARQVVRRPDGTRRLTALEVSLLRNLVSRAGQDVTRETLLAEVWDYSPRAVSRAVDFAVHRLRRKLEADPTQPVHLLTVHGVGYRLVLPAQESPVLGGTNIGPEANAFVGRGPELAALAAAVAAGQRLVTLHGPGGAGKTRLARHFAAGRAPVLAGGAWFCDLSAASGLGDVVFAVVRALSLPVEAAPADALVARVGALLATRGPTLLVLDNAEGCADAVGQAVVAWRAAAASLEQLVTSRTRLRVHGEHVVPVGAMQVQAAIDLFERRAAAACPGFVLAPADRAVVGEVVAQLDGLPLAVELAAGRAGVLAPQELKDRLGARFALLKGAPLGTANRHASLEDAVAASWSLVGPAERQALAQLSVCRGGFDLAAAEAIVALDGGALVVDVVQSLVDQSLLVRAPGVPRFHMGESIRLFAQERLAQVDPQGHAARRHREHYLALAPVADTDEGGSRQARRRVAVELDNLVAVHRWGLARDPYTAVRAVAALRPVLLARGPSDAMLALLDATVQAAGEDPLLRAEALGTRAAALHVRGRLAEALDDLEAALALPEAGERGPQRTAALLSQRGLIYDLLGRADASRADLRDALERARHLGDAWRENRVRGYLGNLAFHVGDHDLARTHFLAALEQAQDLGHAAFVGAMQANLGALAQQDGDLAAAEDLYRRAVALLAAEGDVRREAMVQVLLGNVLLASGRLDEAEHPIEEGIALHERVGNLRSLGIALGALGKLHQLRGDLPAAAAAFDEGVALLEAVGSRHFLVFAHGLRCAVYAAMGDPDGLRLAAEALAAARGLVETPTHQTAVVLAEAHLAAARTVAAGGDPAPGVSAVLADHGEHAVNAEVRMLARSLGRWLPAGMAG